MDNNSTATPSVVLNAFLNPIRSTLTKHPHALWLVLASFSSAYILRFWYLFIRVPKHLSHLPRLSISAFLLGSIRGGGFLNTAPQYKNLIIQDSISRKYSTDPIHKPYMWIMWILGRWAVVINNPKDIKIALTENKKFEKIQIYDYIRSPAFNLLFGPNVGSVQTHDWVRQRKVIYPAFRHGWSTPTFGDPARALISQLDQLALNNAQVNVIEWMQRVTLDVLSSAVFGRNFDSCNNAKAEIVTLYNDIITAATNPAVAMLPSIAFMFPSQRNIKRKVARFSKFLDDMIDEKVISLKGNNSKSKLGPRDLMDLMVEAMLNDEVEFTRNDVWYNTTGFFVAGHDTTASALSFSLYLMGLHPDVQDKARAEVLEVMGDVDSQMDAKELPYPTNEQERKLNYMTCIIKESMRLYPPVTSIPMRITTDDHTFSDGTFIPKGSLVSMNIWDVHRSKHIWGESVEKFDPGRWEAMQSGSDKTQSILPNAHNYEWVPFGGGSRICMGQQFSIMEQRVILSMMLLRYKWTVVGNQTAMHGMPDSSSGLLLHPNNVHLELTRRT